MGPRTQNLLKFAINNSFRLKQEKAEEEKREGLLKRIRELRKAREMQISREENETTRKNVETVVEAKNATTEPENFDSETEKRPEPEPQVSKKGSDSDKPMMVRRFRARSSESRLFRIFKDNGTIKKRKKKAVRHQKFLLMSRSSMRAAKLVKVSEALKEMIVATKSGKKSTNTNRTSDKTVVELGEDNVLTAGSLPSGISSDSTSDCTNGVIEAVLTSSECGPSTVTSDLTDLDPPGSTSTTVDEPEVDEAALGQEDRSGENEFEDQSESIAADLIKFLIEMVVGKSEPAADKDQLVQAPASDEPETLLAVPSEVSTQIIDDLQNVEADIGVESRSEESSNDDGLLDQDKPIAEANNDSMEDQPQKDICSGNEAAHEADAENFPEINADLNQAQDCSVVVRVIEDPIQEPVSHPHEEEYLNLPEREAEVEMDEREREDHSLQEASEENSGVVKTEEVVPQDTENPDAVSSQEMTDELEGQESSEGSETIEVPDALEVVDPVKTELEETAEDEVLKMGQTDDDEPAELSEETGNENGSEISEEPQPSENREEENYTDSCESREAPEVAVQVFQASETNNDSSVAELEEVPPRNPPVNNDTTSEASEEGLAHQAAATEVHPDGPVPSASSDDIIRSLTDSTAGKDNSDRDEGRSFQANAKSSTDENANEKLANKKMTDCPELATSTEANGDQKNLSDLSAEELVGSPTPSPQNETPEAASIIPAPFKPETPKEVKSSKPRRSELTETPSTRTRSKLRFAAIEAQTEVQKTPKAEKKVKICAIDAKALTEKPSARTRSKLDMSSGASKPQIEEGPTKSKALSEKPASRTRSKVNSASVDLPTKKTSVANLSPEAGESFKPPLPVSTKTKRTLDFDEVAEPSRRKITRSRMSLEFEVQKSSSTPIRASRAQPANPGMDVEKSATKPTEITSSVATPTRSSPPEEASLSSSRTTRRSAANRMSPTTTVTAAGGTSKRKTRSEEADYSPQPKKSRIVDPKPKEVASRSPTEVDRKHKRLTHDTVAVVDDMPPPPPKTPRMTKREPQSPAVTTRSRKSIIPNQDQEISSPRTRLARSKTKN